MTLAVRGPADRPRSATAPEDEDLAADPSLRRRVARSFAEVRAGGSGASSVAGAPWRTTAWAACAVLAVACGPAPLAEAGSERLTVEQAAALIAEHSTLPGDTQVVRAVAELWVDYTLLAGHLAAGDSLATLDVSLIVEPTRRDMMLRRLWDEVVQVDTVVTDAELAERFAADLPGARATTSQILFLFPQGVTSQQRASVLEEARRVRRELLGGADFAQTAARHSGDPGSAMRGGSMGTFGRGEMLPELDAAAFGMQPGQLSEPVETALGYHLLRLDAIEVPELSEVGGEFRDRIQRERTAAAEAAYVARSDSAAGLDLAGEALQITRGFMRALPERLSRGAAARPLVSWEGGAYTVGDLLELTGGAPAGFAEGILGLSDQELEAALLERGSEDILLAQARELGLAPSAAEVDSLAAQARSAIRERAGEIGLLPADSADAVPPTPRELVEAALMRVISGQQEIIPLQGAALVLRETGSWRIREPAIAATAASVRGLEIS